jgi:hypothetical protein
MTYQLSPFKVRTISDKLLAIPGPGEVAVLPVERARQAFRESEERNVNRAAGAWI